MKGLSTIMDETAELSLYDDWEEIILLHGVLTYHVENIAREYAAEVLKEAVKRAKIIYEKDERGDSIAFVDEESILSILKELK